MEKMLFFIKELVEKQFKQRYILYPSLKYGQTLFQVVQLAKVLLPLKSRVWRARF